MLHPLSVFLVSMQLAATVAPATQTSSPSGALTVAQAVAEATEHNLGLLAERFNLTIDEARIATARRRPNPVLSVEGDHLDWLGTHDDRVNNAGPQEYSVRTDFVIENGSKRARRIDVAEHAQSAGQFQLENSIRQLTLDVQNACADVILAKETLALAHTTLDAFSHVVLLNERRVKDGDLAEVELLRTQLAQLQFETAVRQSEVKLKSARARLQVLLGRTSAAPFVDITDSPAPRPVVTKEAALERALQRRPDLLQARADQVRSQADIRLQIAQGVVDYSVGAEYRRQQGVAGRGNSVGIFFSSNLPLFNRNQGEIARARAESHQAEMKLRSLELTIRNEVETAFSQFEAARGTLDRLEQVMLARAQDVRHITQFSYERGEASLIEFLDAERAYNDTMQTYNEARADYARSLFALGAASGEAVTP